MRSHAGKTGGAELDRCLMTMATQDDPAVRKPQVGRTRAAGDDVAVLLTRDGMKACKRSASGTELEVRSPITLTPPSCLPRVIAAVLPIVGGETRKPKRWLRYG